MEHDHGDSPEFNGRVAPHSRFGHSGWTLLIGVPSVFVAVLSVSALTSIPVLSNSALVVVPTISIAVTLAVLLSIAALLLVRSRDTVGRRMVAAAAVVSLVATGVIASNIVAFAHEHGVTAVPSAFAPLPLGDSAPDLELGRYTTFAGRDVGLSIWAPQRDEGDVGAAPVLVGVHGGGWTQGDRNNMSDYMQSFADRGFLAISLSYSLSDSAHQNWDLQESQIACGLTWVAQHADRYGGDVDRLMLMGFSAGGNIAFNVASKTANNALASSCGGDIPRVSAVTVNVGASDIAAVWNDSDPLNRESLHTQLTEHLGGSPEQFPERYAAMSSIDAVNPNTPPTLWLYGANDHTVPTDSSERMMRALRQSHIPLEELRVPFGDHSSVGGLPGYVWVERSVEFLYSHTWR